MRSLCRLGLSRDTAGSSNTTGFRPGRRTAGTKIRKPLGDVVEELLPGVTASPDSTVERAKFVRSERVWWLA